MSRPIPRCALCGAKLSYKNRVTVRFRIHGNPEVGWHLECARKDKISPFGDDDPYEDDRLALMERIEARGPGRVIKYRKRGGKGRYC